MRVSPVAVAAHTSIAAVGGASHTGLIPSRTGCQPPRVALAARAQAVTAVRLSAQPPADCSVQRLMPRRRCTEQSAGCWFCSPPNPLQGALRIARAPGGQRLCRSCQFLGRLSVPPWASSQHGHRPTTVRWVARPVPTPRLSFLSPCQASQCTAAWLLRQGPASLRAPAGRPPPRSGCLQGQEGVLGGLGAGGPRTQALHVPGDRRRTRVPDETRAWAGGPCEGSVPPRPSCVAALPG